MTEKYSSIDRVCTTHVIILSTACNKRGWEPWQNSSGLAINFLLPYWARSQSVRPPKRAIDIAIDSLSMFQPPNPTKQNAALPTTLPGREGGDIVKSPTRSVFTIKPLYSSHHSQSCFESWSLLNCRFSGWKYCHGFKGNVCWPFRSKELNGLIGFDTHKNISSRFGRVANKKYRQ